MATHSLAARACRAILRTCSAPVCLCCMFAAGPGLVVEAQTGLKLNQVQIIGTHNSYHAGLTSQESAFIRKSDPVESDALDYRHQSLAAQLDGGMRELEIDVHADPTGGKFDHPRIQQELANLGIADAPFPYSKATMDNPGFKVMHKPNTDFRSNCQPFTQCLDEVASWSAKHKDHLPIYLFIEAKDGARLTSADCDELEKEVLSVFSRQNLFIPEDLLGNHKSLREAAAAGAWPEVDKVRGKVIFLMSRADVATAYEANHPNLRGRLFFTNGPLSDPNTVFAVVSDPTDEKIAALVRSGFLVYTRADADTAEGRSGNVSRRQTAFSSGAQIITTDYPLTEPAPWSGYSVSFPDHQPGRCDPANTVQPCSVGTGQ